MKNLQRIFSGLLLLVLRCAAAPAVYAQKLEGSWRLVEARQNGRRVTLGRDIRTSAVFAAESRLSGNAGCNRYSTAYTLAGRNRIAFEPIISTKMACTDNNYMKQESTFFGVMEKVVKYKIQDNQLIFSDARERNTLRFARVSR